MTLGPVDVVVLEFPGNRFNGELLPLLEGLVADGTIRIIDLVVITRTETGDVAVLEIAGLDETLVAGFASLDITPNAGLLDDDDVALVGERLTPGSTTAMLVWENTWAAGFVEALERADAQLIERVSIPRDVIREQLASAGITL